MMDMSMRMLWLACIHFRIFIYLINAFVCDMSYELRLGNVIDSNHLVHVCELITTLQQSNITTNQSQTYVWWKIKKSIQKTENLLLRHTCDHGCI